MVGCSDETNQEKQSESIFMWKLFCKSHLNESRQLHFKIFSAALQETLIFVDNSVVLQKIKIEDLNKGRS